MDNTAVSLGKWVNKQKITWACLVMQKGQSALCPYLEAFFKICQTEGLQAFFNQ